MNFINKNITKLSVFSGLALTLFLIICIPLSSNELTKLHVDHDAQQISDLDWYYVEGERTVTLPFPVTGDGYESVTIQKQLPNDIPDDYSILLQTCNSIINVYIDDNEIFSFGDNGGTVFGKMLTDLKCIIPLPKLYAGHTLTVVTTPVVSYNGKIPEIYFRTQPNQYLSILMENIWCIIFCTILFVLCLYSLGLGLTKIKHDLTNSSERLLYYSLFSFTVILYLFSNSDIPQLLSGYNEINSLITYLSLAFGVVPLMGIYKALIPHFRTLFNVLQFASCVIVLINIALYMLGICLPSQLLIVTQLLYLVLSIMLIVISFIGQRTRQLTLLNMGNAFLIIIGLSSMVVYYVHPDKNWNVIVLASSVLGFSIFLILEMISMDTKALKEATAKDTIDRVAFIDPLTQIANRSALFKYAKELEKLPPATKVITISIDIDNLKLINDQLGNVAGDIMLQKAAECLSNTFESFGTVYRYEGDEFIVLILNPLESCADYEEKLKNAILVNNRVTPYKLSLSAGSAITEIGTSSENFIDKQIEEAELRMKENKITI